MKVKIKFTLNRPWRSREVVQVQLLFNLSARGGWVINAMLQPLYPKTRDLVTIVQEDGWAPGPVWTGAENLVPTGIWSLECPDCSKLLYWLCYPSPQQITSDKESKKRENYRYVLNAKNKTKVFIIYTNK